MNLYRPFLIAYIIAAFFFVLLLILQMKMVSAIMSNPADPANPESVMQYMFSPLFLISAGLGVLASLAYKIIGIIIISRNPNLGSGEKVLWILGFIFAGIITGILFFALRRQRNLMATERDLAPGTYAPGDLLR